MKSGSSPDPTVIRALYDKKASDYDASRCRSAYHVYYDQTERRVIREYFPPDMTILEVGAGTGRLTNELLARARRVVATDISTEMLKILKDKYGDDPRLQIHQLDAYSLMHAPGYGTFDGLLSMRLLPHIEHITQMLQFFRDAVKPGGRLVFDFWNRHSYVYARKRDSSMYNHYVTFREARRIIECVGLDIVEIRGAGFGAPLAINLEFLGRTTLRRFAYSLIAVCSRPKCVAS